MNSKSEVSGVEPPLVSTSMSGVAVVEVATVHAYGLPLGTVVVELVE